MKFLLVMTMISFWTCFSTPDISSGHDNDIILDLFQYSNEISSGHVSSHTARKIKC